MLAGGMRGGNVDVDAGGVAVGHHMAVEGRVVRRLGTNLDLAFGFLMGLLLGGLMIFWVPTLL